TQLERQEARILHFLNCRSEGRYPASTPCWNVHTTDLYRWVPEVKRESAGDPNSFAIRRALAVQQRKIRPCNPLVLWRGSMKRSILIQFLTPLLLLVSVAWASVAWAS